MPAIILFDGVCNLCNGAVNFVLKRDTAGHFCFVTTQSQAAERLVAQHSISASLDETFVLIEQDEIFYRSDAALRIAENLRWPWRWIVIFRWIPSSWRDWLYDLIARNRYRWFGRRQVCMTPGDEFRHRFIADEESI